MALETFDNNIARAFVEARRAATVLASFPGEAPTNLPAAYAVCERFNQRDVIPLPRRREQA